LALYAQWKVKSTYAKYTRVANMQRMTGAEVAERLLRITGLNRVSIEGTPGELTDHYDPRGRVLRLSQEVYLTPSIAAMGIVAHEVGHAVQDNTGYWPMRLRAGLVPAASLGSNLGIILFFVGMLIRWSGLMWVGVIFFVAAVLFTLFTLPVELNASRRAKQLLMNNGLVSRVEYDAISAVLSAAALTYVAVLLQAIGQLLYFAMVASGMSRSRD
jgi:hypothetical protein